MYIKGDSNSIPDFLTREFLQKRSWCLRKQRPKTRGKLSKRRNTTPINRFIALKHCCSKSHQMERHIPSRRLGPWRCTTTRKASTTSTQCWNKKHYPIHKWQSQTIFPSSLYKFQILRSLFFFQYNRSGKNFQNPFCYQYPLSPNLSKKIYIRYPFY